MLTCRLHDQLPQTRPHYTSLACLQNNITTAIMFSSLNIGLYALNINQKLLYTWKGASESSTRENEPFAKWNRVEFFVIVIWNFAQREVILAPPPAYWHTWRLAATPDRFFDNPAQRRHIVDAVSQLYRHFNNSIKYRLQKNFI